MASARETTTPKSSPLAGIDSIASFQPVAQEIPVIASGARPASASGNRELFTEATSTVLISENSAVIRLSAAVVPGQLLFLVHQESKREVVAQVLRKRYFRPTNCYVELQFTEAAPGFWGMEFPATQETHQSSAEQSAAIARVQTAKATADAPRKATPIPSAQEVTELKREVHALRDQGKSLLDSKLGAASAALTDMSSAVAAGSKTVDTSEASSLRATPQESPVIPSQLSRLPLEPSETFSHAVLEAGPPRTQRKSASRRHSATSEGKRTAEFLRRFIPFAACFLIFGTAGAWYTNHLPGFPPPTVFSDSSSAASTANNPAAPIRPAAKVPDIHENSTNTAQASNLSGASVAIAVHEPSASPPSAVDTPSRSAAYQPDKTPDRGSLVVVTKKNSAVAKIVKGASVASSDETSSTTSASHGNSGVVPPKLLTSVRGIAPPEAARRFVAGNVILDAMVGSDGSVISSTVISGRDSLRASAMERVKQYRYQPATHNGKAIAAHVTVTIQCWFEP